jgi:hypothetical protein
MTAAIYTGDVVESRRLKVLLIVPQLLVNLLKESGPKTFSFEGLPSDSRVLSTRFDCEYERLELVVESSQFPLVDSAAVLERLSVRVTEGAPQ